MARIRGRPTVSAGSRGGPTGRRCRVSVDHGVRIKHDGQAPRAMPSPVEVAGGAARRSYRKPLERLLERPEVDLVRPCRPWLAVNLPVDLGDRIDVQHAILAALFDYLRSKCAQALAIDAAVDDHVRDMDTLRSVFSRHALRDHAQTRLRRCELSIARFAAQAC